MALDDRIRAAEQSLFKSAGLAVDTRFVQLRRTGARLRVLSVGSGQPVLLLHGVSFSAVSWTPLLRELTGFRVHAVEMPGHGLSDPFAYRRGQVRAQTLQLLDELFEEFGPQPLPVIGHSLGGMFALWHAAARPGSIPSLVAVADPAVAIPGAVIRMPLSPLTVPILGPAMLRNPSSRGMYRRLIGTGIGRPAAMAAADELLDVLRFAARQPTNARTVGALMHAIDGFRRPRPESVLTADELRRITTPTLFLWGDKDVYLSPETARPWIGMIPSASLHVIETGHVPWFEAAAECARMITEHLRGTGFPATTGLPA